MLSASLRRVWRTQREKDEDMATKYDEDEDVELQRKKYSEGVWVEDNCEDSKRPTLQENIEKKNTLSLNICTNILSLATGETSNMNNRTLNDRWSGFPH